jgi:flavin-dependent dehydrogenase
MPPIFNILIIGGGIAGFAASVGLARKGHKVTVLERSADLQTFGGTLLIPANALKVLEDYGLLGAFREVAEKWENHIIFRHDGKVLDILSNSANQKIFGYECVQCTLIWKLADWFDRMLNVPRQTYQRLLYEAAVREGVKVRFGARVENLEDSSPRPCVILSTGERIEADLIVGADGNLHPLLILHVISLNIPRHQIHRPPGCSRWQRCKTATKQYMLPMLDLVNRYAFKRIDNSSHSRRRVTELVGTQHTSHLWS